MQAGSGSIGPYCGAPPRPADILAAWNLDPWLLAVLAAAALVPLFVPMDRRRSGFHAMALAVLFVAFVSPICALSSALFSARVAHHLLMVSVAAPLLAMAFPAGGRGRAAGLPVLVLAHLVALWVWHAPAPYALALSDDRIYWLMEVTLLGSAFLVWRRLLARDLEPLRTGLAHLVLIALMGLLGALITFAPEPLYARHFLTTDPFGLSALEDQQLAGLLMWVPAILPNLAAALLCLSRSLSEPRSAPARSA